jgi:predicted transcriptional regulator YheO
VNLIGEAFGPSCEVVLHDLVRPQSSVVHVANGQVTGRAVGQGIRDLVGIVRSPQFTGDMLVGYSLLPQVRSSTVLIRDSRDEVIGAFCINQEISLQMQWKKLLEEQTMLISLDSPEEEPVGEEVMRILERLIAQTIHEYGKPPASLRKEDKLAIVQFLQEKGVFRIRGALERVSTELQISRHSLYKYLEELRSRKG